jgi:3-methylcrotonyl-CoA carboxylase alpha subunit
VAGVSDRPWAFVSGELIQPEVERGPSGRPRRRHAEGTLTAPMPATVRAVLVEPGQQVDKGATLIVLEAMKMELPLRAPEAGTVQSIGCRVGELVQPGVPLVEVV